jgi:hypothetical protein
MDLSVTPRTLTTTTTTKRLYKSPCSYVVCIICLWNDQQQQQQSRTTFTELATAVEHNEQPLGGRYWPQNKTKKNKNTNMMQSLSAIR